MPSYRADHVGGFLRPPALLEARREHAEGRITDTDLCAAEDRAVLAVLDLQRQAGLDVYSDGEYRRAMWLTGLPAAVDGFGPGAMLNICTWRGAALPYGWCPRARPCADPPVAGSGSPASASGVLRPALARRLDRVLAWARPGGGGAGVTQRRGVEQERWFAFPTFSSRRSAPPAPSSARSGPPGGDGVRPMIPMRRRTRHGE